MKFSWLTFCREYRLEFISEGAHSAKGNIHVACPWCGDQDRSEHMGLSLNEREPYYACWRNSGHRGRNPARLIVALLGCTWAEATDIVARDDTSSLDQYEAMAGKYLTPPSPWQPREKEVRPLRLPKNFHPLALEGQPGRDPFLTYLASRGFDCVERMAWYYNLQYCRVGYFSHRVIIPIYYEKRLVNWTGRDITERARLRYTNASEDADVARKQGLSTPAAMGMGSTVFNYDRAIEGGRTLVICEGPFDALKIDWFSLPQDVAVAVFGMPKHAQMTILWRLAQKFGSVRVLLDRAAGSNSNRLWNELEGAGRPIRWQDLPEGVKDPGAMPGEAVVDFLGV